MAAKKPVFDIKSMLNTASLEQATQKRKRIHYKKLIPHEKNHYSLENIEELADAIENVGLLQEPIVKPFNDNYIIISGHRRHLAITKLVEERGLTQFEDIPCTVLDKDEDDVLTSLKLHLTNTTIRNMTEYDKMIAISELRTLIQKAKEKGITIKGKMRDIISDSTKLGTTQVQKYMSIEDQATEDIKEALKKGDITLEEAYESTRKPKREPELKSKENEKKREGNENTTGTGSDEKDSNSMMQDEKEIDEGMSGDMRLTLSLHEALLIAELVNEAKRDAGREVDKNPYIHINQKRNDNMIALEKKINAAIQSKIKRNTQQVKTAPLPGANPN